MPVGLLVRKNTIFPTVSLSVRTDRPAIPWGAAPLLLPVLAFGAGIATAAGLDYGYGAVFGWATTGAWVILCLWHLRPRPPSGLLPMLLLLSVYGCGAWYAAARHPLNDARHFAYHLADDAVVSGHATEVRRAGDRTAVTLQVNRVLAGERSVAVTGKLLAYLPGGADVRSGERIAVSAPSARVPPPLNPGVFDYAAYLAGQSVYHRAYAGPDKWRRVAGPTGFRLRGIGDRSREAWFASLTPYLSGDALAVAAALIMGKRDLLGAEVRSAYADTGAIHVLAVSGLHVGIMALIVMQVLGWLLPRGRAGFALRSAATVAAVWYFALVTGLSASVQRAALMVSVVLLGKCLHRRNSIYHLLAIAALVMLVTEPKQLFQVGFQLSFAAVAGIALFARRIQRWVSLPGKLHYLWDAVSVSTAAQLGTLPLSLYYFGQFPVYFLLSGTLVVVFAYLTLGLGLLHGVVAVCGLPTVATGTVLNQVVSLQNAFIGFCRELPGATASFHRFGIPSAAGLLLFLAVLAYLAYRPSHRGRWAALAVGGVLAAFWIFRPFVAPVPGQFTVYHLPRRTLIDVYDNGTGRAVGDSVPAATLGYQVVPARKGLGVEFPDALPFTLDTAAHTLAVAYPLLRLLDRRVLVLDGKLVYPPAEEWPAADLLLVRNGYRPLDLPPHLVSVPLVVDGSSPPYVVADWRDAYPGAHITADAGAYRYVRE